MVSRFVEQQDIRLANQQLGQRQARALSAREGVDVLFPGRFVKAHAMERGFDAVPPGIAAGQFKIMLHLLVFVEHFVQRIAGHVGHFVLDTAELMRQAMQLGKRQLGFVHHRVLGIEDGVLGEQAELDVFGDAGGTPESGDWVNWPVRILNRVVFPPPLASQ